MIPLLDTHILLWWLGGAEARLSEPQRAVLTATSIELPVHVSDITLWEIATLVSLGRIQLDLPLREWLARAVAPPLVQRHGISPAIAAEVAALPDTFHRDPADRILVATTKVLGATLLTRDRRIIESELVSTIA